MPTDEKDTQPMLTPVTEKDTEDSGRRRFHYQTDPGVSTDTSKLLLRGIGGEDAERARDVKAAVEIPAEPALAMPAVRPRRFVLVKRWPSWLSVMFGAAISVVALFVIVVVGKTIAAPRADAGPSATVSTVPTVTSSVVPRVTVEATSTPMPSATNVPTSTTATSMTTARPPPSGVRSANATSSAPPSATVAPFNPAIDHDF